jgi:hypothetical protein
LDVAGLVARALFGALLLGVGACGGAAAPASGPCLPAEYPCGPYGYAVGSTIADASLYGRRDRDGNDSALDDPAGPLRLAEYFATPGLRALVLSLSTVWCVPCADEQPLLVSLWERYRAGGQVAVLEVLLQRSNGDPADGADADRWASEFKLPFDIAADPMGALKGYYDPNAFPEQIVVRTADMSIRDLRHAAVDATLQSVIDPLLN